MYFTTEDTEGTEFEIFIETQMNADFRKGKQMYDKDPQSFNLRSSAFLLDSVPSVSSAVKYT